MFFNAIDAGTVAVFIPILAVLGGVLISIAAVIVNGKKKELEHRERVAAMEKGIALPEPEKVVKRPAYAARRAWGLVMISFGIALCIGISASASLREGVWGLLFVFTGIGLLIAGALDKKEYEEEKRQEAQGQQHM